MWTLTKQITKWKEDLYFAVTFVRQKLSKHYAEITPMARVLLTSADSLDSFWKLWSFRKWDEGMDINLENEISDTPKHPEV